VCFSPDTRQSILCRVSDLCRVFFEFYAVCRIFTVCFRVLCRVSVFTVCCFGGTRQSSSLPCAFLVRHTAKNVRTAETNFPVVGVV
jgi:hypothetical protein